MRLFVGLGNPGEKYAGNRHNIGFMALDRIAQDHGFSPWRAKFQGDVSEGKFGSTKVILLKPMTFMNKSGQSVGEAVRFYKLDSTDVTVFHDELDLAPGKCRAKGHPTNPDQPLQNRARHSLPRRPYGQGGRYPAARGHNVG